MHNAACCMEERSSFLNESELEQVTQSLRTVNEGIESVRSQEGSKERDCWRCVQATMQTTTAVL